MADTINVQILNIGKMCRTCLSVHEEQLFPLFSSDLVPLSEMISECIHRKITKEEYLPNQICYKCEQDLRVAYSFKRLCEKSFETFNAMISGIDISPILKLETDGKIEEISFPLYSKDDDNEYSEQIITGDPIDDKNTEEHEQSPSLESSQNKNTKIFARRDLFKKKNYSSSAETKDPIESSTLNFIELKCINNSSTEIDELNQSERHIHNLKSQSNNGELSELMQVATAEEYDNCSSDDGEQKPLSELIRKRKNVNREKTEDVLKENQSDEIIGRIKRKRKSKKAKANNTCDICNKTFTRGTHLKRHALTHSGHKPYTCQICCKGFTRLDHLNIHMHHHADKKPFNCDICKRGFIRSEHLRKHKESRHGHKVLAPKTEFCDICKKGFTTPKYLKIHMRSHADRTWNCKFCSETFKSKPELTAHMKQHANDKPYLCSECGLRFVRNDYLVIHMRRHKGEKPYKCKFCGKGFPRATDLTVHERYHTGEKTHLCTVCGKGFQRAYNLLVHTRVHTGERPYQCPHCAKKFAQGNDLKAHVRRHTGERFKCEICGAGFIQGYHLTQHKRSAHGIDMKSHIRRVEKFTTPLEQQQQMQALQAETLKNEMIDRIKTEEFEIVNDVIPEFEIKYEQNMNSGEVNVQFI